MTAISVASRTAITTLLSATRATAVTTRIAIARNIAKSVSRLMKLENHAASDSL